MTSTLPPGSADSPTLFRDRAFWGMTGTQFLGAFNDNLFKQLVMLICVDAAAPDRLGKDYQPLALVLFAVPFVLFSGFAGFLSDRVGKRGIVVAMKVLEIAIMLAGMAAFFLGAINSDWLLPMLFFVLFFMSTQSAFFGPSKYGILPELFADRDLPQANGIIQMTTFLAIIFGFVAAGYGKTYFPDDLWVVSAICVGIAIAGTITSLFVRKTPVAHPGLTFEWSALAINKTTWNMLKGDKPLVGVLFISSLFWFLGGVMQPSANTFGKVQLHLADHTTSLLGAFMGIGIAMGCVLAGKLSHQQVNFGLVRIGSWGLVGSLAVLMLLGISHPKVTSPSESGPIPFAALHQLVRLGMLGVGFFGGLFIVPLQVFMQARPPEDQKGRMIGAMNLINWLAICFAAAFVAFSTWLLEELQQETHWVFGAMALIMVPVAVFYHPPDESLSSEVKPSAAVDML